MKDVFSQSEDPGFIGKIKEQPGIIENLLEAIKDIRGTELEAQLPKITFLISFIGPGFQEHKSFKP